MQNKHGDTVTGGIGYFAHQDIDNFVWLFQPFIQFTGIQPNAIMTDGDAAIVAAIEIVIKKSVHLLCIWLITFKKNMKAF